MRPLFRGFTVQLNFLWFSAIFTQTIYLNSANAWYQHIWSIWLSVQCYDEDATMILIQSTLLNEWMILSCHFKMAAGQLYRCSIDCIRHIIVVSYLCLHWHNNTIHLSNTYFSKYLTPGYDIGIIFHPSGVRHPFSGMFGVISPLSNLTFIEVSRLAKWP